MDDFSKFDEGLQVVQETQAATCLDPVKVPVGLITRSCAKKSKDSLMALVRVVQDQEGTFKFIEGVELERQPMKTLIYVEGLVASSKLIIRVVWQRKNAGK